ncbi:MAG: adenylate kinase [Elusimicrobia bacterium]|nr:adenylate kinase [Elusimicrobiota bacterium]
MNIILLGYPGSGKGTQAKLLVSNLNYKHLSTGDMFRDEIAKKTQLGEKVKSYINNGKLVPDDVVLEVIESKLKDIGDNVLFDGFPRTIEQAEGLEILMDRLGRQIEKVFFFDVDENNVIKRIINRRSCPKCQRIYNLITDPPKNADLCDVCGVKVVERDDDKEEVVTKRMQVYKDLTAPLISYYKSQGIFVQIDASKSVEDVYNQVIKHIN